ncbi:hypothetical protein HJFPF1_10984 [Paramyrothecium foliicola]|nr:hypothetical protein HJFPF1_10984 [Paramyrothecium foliicola]
MAEVYSEAYLVIAAASANADNRGFLSEPDRCYRGVGLESQEGSGLEDLTIHRVMPHSGSLENPASLSPVSIGPLGERAWTLQETLLARRCVGFNQYEIAWECLSSINCECGEILQASRYRGAEEIEPGERGEWVYGVSHGGLEDGGKNRRFHTRPLSQLPNISTLFTEWHLMILPNYTKRSLTVPGDKLPAISAIAKIIAGATGSEYIAGVWKDQINVSLAWRVATGRERITAKRSLPSPVTPNAPSFSWASVDDPITYQLPDPRRKDGGPTYGSITVEVLDYNVPLSSENKFGAVKGGWIKLSGLSHTLDLGWNASEKEYELSGKTSHRLHRWQFQLDTALREVPVKHSSNEYMVSAGRATSELDINEITSARVQGLLILDVPSVETYTTAYGYKRGYFRAHEVAVLVLGLISSDPEHFQRLGLATVALEADVAQHWIASAIQRDFVIV